MKNAVGREDGPCPQKLGHHTVRRPEQLGVPWDFDIWSSTDRRLLPYPALFRPGRVPSSETYSDEFAIAGRVLSRKTRPPIFGSNSISPT